MTRVLVIDDCEEVAEIIKQLLERNGFSVEMAHDSVTALSRMNHAKFDVVLCDLVLPLEQDEVSEGGSEGDSAMVGMHCIHELSSRHPQVPVIAMSGELVGAPLSVAEKFGAKGTLSKPFNGGQLLDVVNGVLHKPCQEA